MKPTVEFSRRHDVEPPRVDDVAFRQGWRVRSRLDQLLADRRINAGEWQAANDFRAAWTRALEISLVGDLRLVASGSRASNPHDRMLALVASVDRLEAVADRIGPHALGLVVACVVEDLPWAATAKYLARNPETVRDQTALAVQALARAWEGSTRRRGQSGYPNLSSEGRRRLRAS